MTQNVLLIGRNGQVTTYLQRAFATGAESKSYSVMVADRETLDLARIANIQPTLEKLKPNIIINPAAYTAVDQAEQESDIAFTINRNAVAEIAEYCKKSGALLIHFSTDYVFSGDTEQAYTELDEPAPTGVYGQSKLAGEQAILTSGAAALILRTSWVYSNHGKNFYKTMLNLAQTRDELSVVADQFGAPTYAGSIADATKSLVEKVLANGGLTPEQGGVYHFSCQGQTSWCDFAKALFVENGVTKVVVNPIPTSDYPTPAKRPAFSVLDGTKLRETFGISLPHWQTALAHCAAEKLI